MAGLVINVPYGGLEIPPAVQKRLPLSADDLRGEHWRLCDPHLLSIFQKAAQGDDKRGPWPLIHYPFSPLVADPLGLLAQELDQTRELGPFVLTKTTTGRELPQWSEKDRLFLLEKTTVPYAAELKRQCLAELEGQNLLALITVRSFSSEPQAFERDRRFPRPQISLGSSDAHTPEGLAELAGHVFRSLGFWPQLNWPASGAAVPLELAGQPRLKALGLALRRDLYLDEKTGRLKESLEAVVRVMRTFLNLLSQELDRVAEVKLRRAFRTKKASNVIKADRPTAEA
ncbi:MAG: N-formylglutamate amidohydrolase [Deltaproteobacteria bacterium]|jgi:N-formylglutamate amidohydrolase|nr:N-formylglutamate amidohydrolase [Deltaproteobacteria bacterium]